MNVYSNGFFPCVIEYAEHINYTIVLKWRKIGQTLLSDLPLTLRYPMAHCKRCYEHLVRDCIREPPYWLSILPRGT